MAYFNISDEVVSETLYCDALREKGDGQGRVNYEVAQEALGRCYHFLTLLASDIAPDLAQNSAVNWISIPVTGYPTEFLRNFIFAQKVLLGSVNTLLKWI